MTLPASLPDETPALRRCIRDLVALSGLPAAWQNHDAQHIAESVATALLSMSDADFVHIRLPSGGSALPVEVTRVNSGANSDAGDSIRATIAALPADQPSSLPIVPHRFGAGQLRIVRIPIGFSSGAALTAGSRQTGFPTETQRLLLSVGANETAAGVQRLDAEAAERRLATLVERSSDFIGLASPDGQVDYINPAGRAAVGLDVSADLDGIGVLDFFAPEEVPRVRDQLWRQMLRDGRWAGEIDLRNFRTGAKIPFLHEWFVIENPRSARPLSMATISRDLTMRKRWEAELRELNASLEHRVAERTAELAAANRNLHDEIDQRHRADIRLKELQAELFHAARLSEAGQMAGSLAHELNQPLAAIANSIGTARLLLTREQVDTDMLGEIVDETTDQVLRAGQIIRRLRNFVARGEAEKRVESVVAMVEEASALSLAGSAAFDVQTHFYFDPTATHALTDRIQIQQVIANVMRNALEAIAGAPRRELAITTLRLNAEQIEISVADSGPGLSDELREKVFRPFFTTKRNGMGLGLSICRSIVEAHGGRLWCEHNPEGGAVFCFTLVAAMSENQHGG